MPHGAHQPGFFGIEAAAPAEGTALASPSGETVGRTGGGRGCYEGRQDAWNADNT
jgi:hypothetical protein